MSRRRVLLADRLYAGRGPDAVEHAALVLDGERIGFAGPREVWEATADPADEVHQYDGATILPGLIDGHVHLCLSAAPTAEEVLTELLSSGDARRAALAAENARRCLAGGVTTVRDCGGPGTLIQSLRDAIADGLTAGPTVLACGMPITTTGGHCHFFGLRADSRDEVRKAVRQLVQDDADWIKVMATGGRLTRNSNILRAQYTRAELDVAVEEAHRLERRVAAHVLSVEGIRVAVEAGVDTLEHCTWNDAHGDLALDHELLAEVERRDIAVSLTIVGSMRDAYRAHRADPERTPLPPVLRTRHAMEGDLFRRGLRAFVTSDAGVPACRFDELHESLAIAVEGLGLAPHTALEAVTSRAAEALGILHQVGTLEVGKAADVLVVAGDPLRDITAMADRLAVYRRGTLVCRDGAVFPPGWPHPVPRARSSGERAEGGRAA